MGRERIKTGIYKTINIMSPREADAYSELLDGWCSSRELSEYQKKKTGKTKEDTRKRVHTTIGKYLNNFVKHGWVEKKADYRLFGTKEKPIRRKVWVYKANIKPFIDTFFRNATDSELDAYFYSSKVEPILYLFYELKDVKKMINIYSLTQRFENKFISKISKEGWTTKQINKGISFNALNDAFKSIIDKYLLFNQSYFAGVLNKEEINKSKRFELLVLSKYFTKTKKLIKKYYSLNGKTSCFQEERDNIINSFEIEFGEISKLKFFGFLRKISKFLNKDHPAFMWNGDVKIRLFAGLLYETKSFNGMRCLFLGHTANKLISLYKP